MMSSMRVIQSSPDLQLDHIEIDNLKTIIVALNQKLSSHEDIQRELTELNKGYKESEESREDLR
jgi:hypothetical protein